MPRQDRSQPGSNVDVSSLIRSDMHHFPPWRGPGGTSKTHSDGGWEQLWDCLWQPACLLTKFPLLVTHSTTRSKTLLPFAFMKPGLINYGCVAVLRTQRESFIVAEEPTGQYLKCTRGEYNSGLEYRKACCLPLLRQNQALPRRNKSGCYTCLVFRRSTRGSK